MLFYHVVCWLSISVSLLLCSLYAVKKHRGSIIWVHLQTDLNTEFSKESHWQDAAAREKSLNRGSRFLLRQSSSQDITSCWVQHPQQCTLWASLHSSEVRLQCIACIFTTEDDVSPNRIPTFSKRSLTSALEVVLWVILCCVLLLQLYRVVALWDSVVWAF